MKRSNIEFVYVRSYACWWWYLILLQTVNVMNCPIILEHENNFFWKCHTWYEGLFCVRVSMFTSRLLLHNCKKFYTKWHYFGDLFRPLLKKPSHSYQFFIRSQITSLDVFGECLFFFLKASCHADFLLLILWNFEENT